MSDEGFFTSLGRLRVGAPMRPRLSRLAERLGMSYWLIPGGCVAAAMGLSFLAQAIDSHLSDDLQAWYLFSGGPEGARAVFSSVASSMMTFAGLVFSVTILVLQQASNQYSPRVLRTFLRDRKSQLTLGIFLGTFAYALLGLRNVWGTAEGLESHVPSLSVWLSAVLVLLSVVTFIFYIHHVAQSIRAINILVRIREETGRTLEHMYPEGVGEDTEDAQLQRPEGRPSLLVPYPATSGVLVSVDEEQLFSQAREAHVTIALVPMVGDFVPHGSTLLEVWGPAARLDAQALLESINIGPERTLQQDTAFGFRQLVDVAERALSPSTNDPTTAVQAMDQLHELLRRLVRKRFASPCRKDEQGMLRLICPRPDWSSYVRLAVDEVRQYGERSLQVSRRLRFLLEDLLQVAPPFRREELERQLALLEASVERSFADVREVAMARRASPQGHGPI